MSNDNLRAQLLALNGDALREISNGLQALDEFDGVVRELHDMMELSSDEIVARVHAALAAPAPARPTRSAVCFKK